MTVSACAVWLLAPVRDRMGGECRCPSTGTPWTASRTASTVAWWASSWTCWCGSGHCAIHDDPSGVAAGAFAPPSRQCRLAAHRGLFDALQWGTPSPLRSRGAAHNTHDKEILLANDGFCTRFAVPAEPPLLSPTRARHCPPASAACVTRSPAVRRAFSPSSASATVAGRNSPKRRAV